MRSQFHIYALPGIKAILTLAFGLSGISKLIGAEQMVALFDLIGWGQWFRYLTGLFEIGGIALLWVPGFQFVGAGILVATMIGAVVAHVLILGPSLIPAAILGILAAVVALAHRPGGT